MQVKDLVDYITSLQAAASRLEYNVATVSRVVPLDMGDRICVDLCSKMAPGEGLLVGNFCRALFLVHSEVRSTLLSRLLHLPYHAFSALLCRYQAEALFVR
jgi:3-dehydroquinate synthase class II